MEDEKVVITERSENDKDEKEIAASRGEGFHQEEWDHQEVRGEEVVSLITTEGPIGVGTGIDGTAANGRAGTGKQPAVVLVVAASTLQDANHQHDDGQHQQQTGQRNADCKLAHRDAELVRVGEPFAESSCEWQEEVVTMMKKRIEPLTLRVIVVELFVVDVVGVFALVHVEARVDLAGHVAVARLAHPRRQRLGELVGVGSVLRDHNRLVGVAPVSRPMSVVAAIPIATRWLQRERSRD